MPLKMSLVIYFCVANVCVWVEGKTHGSVSSAGLVYVFAVVVILRDVSSTIDTLMLLI